MKTKPWKETTVRLSEATLTTFDGPGDDFVLIVAGKRRSLTKRIDKSKRRPIRN